MTNPAAPSIDKRGSDEVDAALEAKLARHLGWQPWEMVPFDALRGRVLYDDLVNPDAGGERDHLLAVRGARVDPYLAQRIEEAMADPVRRGKVSRLVKVEVRDPAHALVRVTSRLAELVIDRLNRVPDKSFVAFLDFVGVQPLSPQPARVPLTFHLAAGGQTEGRVPERTQVAGQPAEGEPVLFETEREVSLTRSELVAAVVREPGRDAWRDAATLVSGEGGPVPVFEGDRPVPHRLMLAHSMFGGQGPRDLLVEMTPAEGETLPALNWSWWDGATWHALEPRAGASAGRFVFPAAQAMPVTELEGRPGCWLSAALPRDGVETSPPPPFTLAALRVGITVEGKDILPDQALSGTTPLDTTKDFLPFGERPRLGDCLYLASDAAFGSGGPTSEHSVTLTLVASALAADQLPTRDLEVALVWEYWAGAAWRVLGRSTNAKPAVREDGDGDFGFQDATMALTGLLPGAAATVTFRRPADWRVSNHGGNDQLWLRVRLSGGGYGRDFRYVLTDVGGASGGGTAGATTKGYVFDPPTYRPPSLGAARLGYRRATAPAAPEQVLAESDLRILDHHEPARAGRPFQPFGPSEDKRPSLYLAFSRPGSPIGFANAPVTLYLGVADVVDPDPALRARSLADPPVMVWEYWNGRTFAALGGSDETRGMLRRGLVTFVGPADFVASTRFGRTAFWLRIRWEKGTHAQTPALRRVLTNTTWAAQTQRLAHEVLGSATGETGLSLKVAKPPVLPGQVLEVREMETPSRADLDGLLRDQGSDGLTVISDADGHPTEVWVRWTEVPDFHGSLGRERHYTIDRQSGALTFGDGKRGRVPPRGSDNVRISYLTGGGTQGNLAAGLINQLKSALPYVDKVTNFEPGEGGSAAEDMAAVKLRGPRTLRHRFRAVTHEDFQDLAFEASPAVAKARALGATGAEGAGQVLLVVVPRGSEPRPMPTLELLQRVEDFVVARALPTVALTVRGPDWMEISVDAGLATTAFEGSMDALREASQRLSDFLHPLTGNDGEGWAFGRKPRRSDLYSVLEGVPGIDHVAWLTIDENRVGHGGHPIGFLVSSGTHSLTLVEGPPGAERAVDSGGAERAVDNGTLDDAGGEE